MTETSSDYVTKNLRADEVACPCCGQVEYDRKFVDSLQIIRDLVGIPFIYTSFFRCKDYNDSLSNSSKTSKHTLGKACDISTDSWSGNDKWLLAKYSIGVGLSVGVYAHHIHLDNRDGDPTLFAGSY